MPYMGIRTFLGTDMCVREGSLMAIERMLQSGKDTKQEKLRGKACM